MNIGFVGVGTIATCMLEGFQKAGNSHEFFLSPRNTKKSSVLAKKYSNCHACDSNQEVVDKSDVVILSLLADNCIEVLEGLNFRFNQKIVNVVATIPPEDILGAVGKNVGFSHVIPLPSCKNNSGPIAAFPKSEFLLELFSPIGKVVFASSMNDIRTMQSITALIAPFYSLMSGLADFAEGEGLERYEAKSFITTFFASLCQNLEGADFKELAAEMTPGGLNELANNILAEKGAITAWADVMKPVMQRINRAEKGSAGSLPPSV